MPNYILGKIYKIVNSINRRVYIGSTCQRFLATRMGEHRRDSNNKQRELYCDMRRFGFDKFRMILITNYPCTSKAELEAKEYEILNQYIETKIPVYNIIVNGKCAEATKKKISIIKNKGGSVYFSENKKCWMFSYRLSGQKKRSEYPVFRFGYEEAERLARKQQRNYHSNLIMSRITEFLEAHNKIQNN